MRIRVIDDLEDLFCIKAEWDDLFSKEDYSVFQSFDFCYNSLSSTSCPFVICLLSNDKICEIWPLEIIFGKLRFINDTHADFCDIISQNQESHVREYLIDNNHLGKLRLNNLMQNAKVICKLNDIQYSVLSFSIKFSILSLLKTDNFPANFTHFVYRQKRRLIRILNKFSSEHILYSHEKTVFPLDKILDLRNEMISNGTRNERFLDNKFLSLAEKLYKERLVIVSAIEINNKVSAISLILHNRNKYYFWVDLFNNYKMVNLYHNTLFIKNITEEYDAVFNFGRGAYNYKIQNFQPEVFNLYNFYVFGNIFEVLFFQIINILKKSARYLFHNFIR